MCLLDPKVHVVYFKTTNAVTCCYDGCRQYFGLYSSHSTSAALSEQEPAYVCGLTSFERQPVANSPVVSMIRLSCVNEISPKHRLAKLC